MTPSAYLIPSTDVPVTIGRRVREVAALLLLLDSEVEVEEGARTDPPAERVSDIL